MKTRPKVLLPSLLLVYLCIEGLCFGGLLLLDRVINVGYNPNPSTLSGQQKASLEKFLERKQGEQVSQDPVLGWVRRSEANSAGMRDDREYSVKPPPGVLRIAAFGDSFTYGSDVDLHETWTKQISAIEPSIEVLNYGMGAYGLDQAYLRYSKVASDYPAQAVFIGYMSENIGRHVNVFRGFYTNMYRSTIFTKPRFLIKNGELVLLDNPLSTMEDYSRFLRNDREVLREIGTHDYHYQTHYSEGRLDFSPAVRLLKMSRAMLDRQLFHPYHLKPEGLYNTHSEAYEVTVRIFDAFYRDVNANGATPIILVFPDQLDQHRHRQKQPRAYEPLLEHFRSKGYRYIDVLDALAPYEPSYSIEELTRNWGHFSPLGSKIIAEYILAKLEAWDIGNTGSGTQ
jgi:hypothetical protein